MELEAFHVLSRLSFALCFVDKWDFRKALQSPPPCLSEGADLSRTMLRVFFGLRSPELTYGIKGSTAGGSVSIAVMSEQLTPQLAV